MTIGAAPAGGSSSDCIKEESALMVPDMCIKGNVFVLQAAISHTTFNGHESTREEVSDKCT